MDLIFTNKCTLVEKVSDISVVHGSRMDWLLNHEGPEDSHHHHKRAVTVSLTVSLPLE